MEGKIKIVNSKYSLIVSNDEEYYLHIKNSLNSHNNDVVKFEIFEYKGKTEARVLKILKRYTNEFVGRITHSKNFSFVSVDGFSQDIYISKKNRFKSKDNDLVKVKIYLWENEKRKAEAKVIQVLGSSDNAENIVKSKLMNMGIVEEFSKDIMKDNSFLNIDKGNRVDLTNTMHITIDGEDTKDLDDAIYLEKKGDKYILYVSIADVASYVKEGSSIDEEAFKRANSIYLYDRSIPMLPRFLTNDLCSLNPHKNKLTFTVKIVFNEKAKVIEHNFFKSIINSKYRLSYNQVNDIFSGKDNNNYEYKDMLLLMSELSDKLSAISQKRGNIEFEIPELKLKLDNNKKLSNIIVNNRGKAEILIENFMVSANNQVAVYMFNNDIPCVYRIHEKPDIEAMYNLNNELNKVGLSVKNPNILVNKLQNIIQNTKNTKLGYSLHKLILKSMKKAIYSSENKGHFGLALKDYLHFTSPIRRYSDLVVHRNLEKSLNRFIGEKEKHKMNKKINKISKHISKQERDSQRIEYMARDIKIAEYMNNKIGESYRAIVSSIFEDRVFITLDNYVEALLENRGEYILGDSLDVIITKVDIYNGKIYAKRKV